MKAVEVRYRVRPEYVEQNKANVRRVMEALRARPIEGMLYSTYTIDHGSTFVHINIARDAETLGRLSEVAEFREFQAALKESKPMEPPVASELNLVAASFAL